MKINFTNKEFRTLLELVHVGAMVAEAAEASEEGHDELCAKLRALAPELGCADCVEKFDDEIVPSEGFEFELHEKILDPYADTVFWNELALQLATRDLGRSNPELVEADDFSPQIIEAMAPLMQRYSLEFAENGLENLELVGGGKNKRG
ncbi:MAG: hypothetical protein Q7P63_11110 [Verrucomicrobiota bacterium JB022]|nr:hypothetical protein [Verrucomicrobiota bacterium JB022]